MKYLEEFTIEGKNFLYINLAGLRSNEKFMEIMEESKPIIISYAGRQLYTIINIEGVRFDTKTKNLAAEWALHNQPYVLYGVVIGMDSIKQIMVNAVLRLGGRKNMSFASTKEKAIELLLSRE